MRSRTRKPAARGLVQAGRRAAVVIAASAAALGVSIGPAMAADGRPVPGGPTIGAGGIDVPDPNIALPTWLTQLVPGQSPTRPPIQMYRPVVGPAGERPDGAARATARPNDPTWTLIPEQAPPGPGPAVESRPVRTVTVPDAEVLPPALTWTVVRPGSADRQAEQQPPRDPTWT